METEIKFQFKPRLVEAQAALALTIGKTKLAVDAYITANYGPKGPFKSFKFIAKLTFTAERVKVQKIPDELKNVFIDHDRDYFLRIRN